jgi:hypothetical protein
MRAMQDTLGRSQQHNLVGGISVRGFLLSWHYGPTVSIQILSTEGL